VSLPARLLHTEVCIVRGNTWVIWQEFVGQDLVVANPPFGEARVVDPATLVAFIIRLIEEWYRLRAQPDAANQELDVYADD
jgi:hypothetical protein